MIKMKNKLFGRKKRKPTNENVKCLYNIFRNRVNRELKRSEKHYNAAYFEEHNKNIKKIWEGIRSIVNIKNSINPKIAQLNMTGEVVDKPKQIVNKLNDYFVNVRPNRERIVQKVPNITSAYFLKNRNQFKFIIAHIY